MEHTRMSTQGIVIEKLTIGWLQLLAGAFVLGGFTYTSASTYAKAVEVEAKQEAYYAKYVPIIEKLNSEAEPTRTALTNLNATMSKFNENMAVILALRDKEEKEGAERIKEKDRLQKQVLELGEKVTELQIEVTRLKR